MPRGSSKAAIKAAEFLTKNPTMLPMQLAMKFGLDVSTVYRAKWWKDHQQALRAQKEIHE